MSCRIAGQIFSGVRENAHTFFIDREEPTKQDQSTWSMVHGKLGMDEVYM
jgi:hypothetical protein